MKSSIEYVVVPCLISFYGKLFNFLFTCSLNSTLPKVFHSNYVIETAFLKDHLLVPPSQIIKIINFNKKESIIHKCIFNKYYRIVIIL